MGDCVDCGGEVKNKNVSGHYRDRCHDCIAAVADVTPAEATPINGCECSRCLPS